LLADGKVLLAAGWQTAGVVQDPVMLSAEVYDPSRGQWIATASMVAAREAPTATLLLDGRVLVAGGDFSGGPDDVATAELYDPTGGP
jgi:hypothetical protein